MDGIGASGPPSYDDPVTEALHQLLFKKAKVKDLRHFLAQNPTTRLAGARSDGLTALHIVASTGSKSMAKELLTVHKCPPNVQEKHGATPLSIAAQQGHHRVVKQLIKHGADAALARHDGVAPLYIAAQGTARAQGNGHHHGGHADVVKLLLDAKADPNVALPNGATPLFIAAQKGKLKVVQLLLAHGGVNINAPVEDMTPLEAAIRGGHLQVAQLLILAKAAVLPPTHDVQRQPSEAARALDKAMQVVSSAVSSIDTELLAETPPTYAGDEAVPLLLGSVAQRMKKKDLKKLSKKQVKDQYVAACKALQDVERQLVTLRVAIKRDSEDAELKLVYWKMAFCLLSKPNDLAAISPDIAGRQEGLAGAAVSHPVAAATAATAAAENGEL